MLVHILLKSAIPFKLILKILSFLQSKKIGSKIRKNREELRAFLSVSRVKLYALTKDTATFYGQIYSSLKKKGKPIPTNDMWIAAQALEMGCVLCTFDKHFKEIESLLTGVTSTDLFI